MKNVGLGMIAIAAVLMAVPAMAQSNADVLGSWQVVTIVQGSENKSTITLAESGGQLGGKVSGRGGATDLLNVSFTEGVLKWGIKIPQAGDQILMTEVTVKGDTFEGAMDTPLGKLPVKGSRVSAEKMEEMANREKSLIGDWNVYTDVDGEVMASEARFYYDDTDGDLQARLETRGSRVEVRRMRFDGESLMMAVGIPFINEEPMVLNAKLEESGEKFVGKLRTPYGEYDVTMEIVNTEKLVVAPYDDPTPIMGEWEMTATIDGTDYPSKLIVNEQDYRLHCDIEGEAGTYESSQVEYKQVTEEMGSLRIEVVIPELGAEAQFIEIIVDGDEFEGEEVNSNGTFLVTGKRK